MIESITLSNDTRSLRVISTTGLEADVDATTLRAQAMDSKTRRQRLSTGTIEINRDICITTVQAMGTTGVNIQFSDGHRQAIYPYPYLARLAFGDSTDTNNIDPDNTGSTTS